NSADGVLGQVNLSTGAANRGGIPGVNTLSDPRGLAVDGGGNLWVADTGNSRVLRFNAPVTSGRDAALVMGQQFFWVNRPNDSNGDNVTDSAQAQTLNAPNGVSADDEGHLWVADTGNHRVLRFDPPFAIGMEAGLVLGQADFQDNAANRGQPGPSDATMNLPEGVFVTRDNFVWVADSGNHRVLRFHDPAMDGTEADMLLGQLLYTLGAANRGGADPAADTLSRPSRMALDATGSLLVADTDNHRVLKYFTALSIGMPAEEAVGQVNPVSGDPNWGGAPAANTLSGPVGVMADRAGNVWVADSANNR
ncbi:MAG: NHL repeat-containing protein, partial [Endomicrobiales bacterium]